MALTGPGRKEVVPDNYLIHIAGGDQTPHHNLTGTMQIHLNQ